MVSLRQKFENNGFIIVKNLISKKLISSFIEIYNNKFLNSDNDPYAQMNSQKIGKKKVNKYGYLQDPIADIHCLNINKEKHNKFVNKSLDIILNKKILKILEKINNFQKHNLMMSMMFDQNVGTPPHQDWYYLDSLPNGNITGVWIALEDINYKAGRFFVVPGSNKMILELKKNEIKKPDLYEKKIELLLKSNKCKIFAPSLRKGDVLFWNSGTIHGSKKTVDDKFSRKSFTAHFLPSKLKFVTNRYENKVRKMNFFKYKDQYCRITNSYNNTKKNSFQRSLKSFNKF